jgi:hypothetical protein
MPNVWTRAFATESPVILGYRLRPLAAHHVLALAHLGNGYFSGGDIDIDGLISVPLVCADDFQHRMRTYRHFAFSRTAKAAMMLRLRGRRGQVAHEQISAYMTAGVEEPELWQESNEDGSPAAAVHDPIPWALRLAATLMRYYHMPLADAMNLPITQASALTAILARDHGSKLVDEDQIAEMEAAALCQN